MMQWEKYFKPPFIADEYGCYVFDSVNQMVLMFEDRADTLRNTVVAFLNGEKFKPVNVSGYKTDGCDVLKDDELVFCARGWGYLTGSLKLPAEIAAAIQDEFLDYIVKGIALREEDAQDKEGADQKDEAKQYVLLARVLAFKRKEVEKLAGSRHTLLELKDILRSMLDKGLTPPEEGFWILTLEELCAYCNNNNEIRIEKYWMFPVFISEEANDGKKPS